MKLEETGPTKVITHTVDEVNLFPDVHIDNL